MNIPIPSISLWVQTFLRVWGKVQGSEIWLTGSSQQTGREAVVELWDRQTITIYAKHHQLSCMIVVNWCAQSITFLLVSSLGDIVTVPGFGSPRGLIEVDSTVACVAECQAWGLWALKVRTPREIPLNALHYKLLTPPQSEITHS